jgi:hypothetical protein
VDQVGRKCWQTVVLNIRPPILEGDVLTFDEADFLQPLQKRDRPFRGTSSLPRIPTIGTAPCCAPATSGQAAAPPSPAINSRLLIRNPQVSKLAP